MTYAGPFAFFNSDAIDGTTVFTLYKQTPGTQNQTTGARIVPTFASSSIKGSLDAMTEADLQLTPGGHIQEGSFRFNTEQSYGVKPGDIIKDARGVHYRVVRRLHLVPIINDRFREGGASGSTAYMDVESYEVLRTKEAV